MKAFRIPKWESSRLELKLDVFNVFNHALFILNNSNDALTFLALPTLQVPVDPNNPNGPQMANPNFNSAASAINPFTALYLDPNGLPPHIQPFPKAPFTA